MSRAGRRLLAILAAPTALAAALASPGCSKGAKPSTAAPAAGGTLVLGSISDVDAWNEYVSGQSFAIAILRRIDLRLAQELGATRSGPPPFEPLLAESWTATDDGRTLTFRLREATWSDGAPITSADVVFTWKAQTSPEVAWIGAKNKAHVTAVEAPDPRTAVFRFDRAYPEQLADAVDGGIVPEHVFGKVPFAQWRTHDWSTERIASGPFVLAEHRRGESIALVRNPRYFRQGRPLADKLVVRIVPDAGSLVSQLLAGGIDVFDGVPPQDAARARAAPGVEVLPYDTPGFDYIGWNGRRKPFDDPEVRRALTLAIDRRAIVEDLLYGFGRVCAGAVPSTWWCTDPDARPWPYDPAAAKRILEAKGYGPANPLSFELTTNAGNRLREAVIVKIQEQLAKVGVAATPRPVEMRTFREANEAGRFDAYVAGWRFSGKIDLATIFGSDALPPNGSNVVAYRSVEADRLIASLASGSDWKALLPVYAAITRRLHEDQPYTFLFEPKRILAAGPRVTGAVVDVPADPLARIESFGVAP